MIVWLVVLSRIVKLVIGSVGLRHGALPISFEATSLEGRMRAVGSLPTLWVAGWSAYALASLALLALFVAIADWLPARAGRATLAAATAGVTMEMLTCAIQVSLLEIADPRVYAAVERIGWLVATVGSYAPYSVAVAIATIGLRDRYARIAGVLLVVPMAAVLVAGLSGRHGWIEGALGTVTWMWCVFAVAAARPVHA